ncbi:outer membrane protein assembly factor BamD [Frateuria sp. STR12]|uniref:outer membrane protein assembly factor BamD n=1 Tax=Frateuria hangzhouensis TaxID=2995589 RepID=UPI002260AA3E|nr:outer membrane protein assembly factor BamD [Frateuria sp. STR12]MCX7514089.1 outer membrane protein assembly factor BamD [Frateuria sp. STR12]
MRVFFKLLAVLVIGLSLGACSMFGSKRETIDTMSVEKLYATAHDDLMNGDYAAAIKAYQRLIARFPSGDYNEQSQLELAYSQYKDNQPEDAYSTVNRFIKTFPRQKHVDYAYYLRGLINFDRTSGVIERFFPRNSSQARRDQAYNLQAFDDFSELARRYPDSAYTTDARQRMIYLRNILAQYEINVAKFYLRNEAFVASAKRAQYVVEHYQQAPQTGDALAILARSYLALNQKGQAENVRKVLAANYPDHPYLTDSKWPHPPSTLRKMIPFSGHH